MKLWVFPSPVVSIHRSASPVMPIRESESYGVRGFEEFQKPPSGRCRSQQLLWGWWGKNPSLPCKHSTDIMNREVFNHLWISGSFSLIDCHHGTALSPSVSLTSCKCCIADWKLSSVATCCKVPQFSNSAHVPAELLASEIPSSSQFQTESSSARLGSTNQAVYITTSDKVVQLNEGR